VDGSLLQEGIRKARGSVGSNENKNGLLRQDFPEATNLSVHSQERLDEIARQLDGRSPVTLPP
jgi:IS30 family transposase